MPRLTPITSRAPAELADAAITLDGEGGYRLPQEALKGWLRRDVGNIASGKHEVAIEKPGYDPIRLHFTTGVERRALEITIDASEVRRTKAQ